LILLPTGRVTLLISRSVGESLLALVDESESPITVAAIPTVTPPTDTSNPVLADWGVAARILRLGRPQTRNPSQAYHLTIAGQARIRLTSRLHIKGKDLHTLVHCPVEYVQNDGIPSRTVVAAFKAAALNLLDKLAKSGPRKEQWARLAGFVEDVSDQRAAWIADAMVSTIDADFNDKLGAISSFSPLEYRFSQIIQDILSTTDVESRIQRTTELFTKLASISEISTKIASAVDENLSKQQKEFFLRQQLAAIQKELQSLNKSRSGSGSDLEDDDQNEADDLADLKRKIEAMEQGSEERKTGVAEWRRLKRIPQGSAENSVTRNYVSACLWM
jgi:ATP-dependent Lon protease